ncbi:hypothetical protein M427DRAFT_66097 [Gonapodya prolifera JEL478]|uniref:Uncharacterized protein n=1 Tax=Gonapodya prolifera (strain JEL478) TaxID=1344416 RepID=A0A139AXC6_GONPJ|nr:hypothetical protein M427DRAFT_66097 [Gonapodya prolifera JEL478]|eukprot:KXS21378.1 hypothetical protein M427DRAFT_66097 [Gonapodya prolifera JEL478]
MPRSIHPPRSPPVPALAHRGQVVNAPDTESLRRRAQILARETEKRRRALMARAHEARLMEIREREEAARERRKAAENRTMWFRRVQEEERRKREDGKWTKGGKGISASEPQASRRKGVRERENEKKRSRESEAVAQGPSQGRQEEESELVANPANSPLSSPPAPEVTEAAKKPIRILVDDLNDLLGSNSHADDRAREEGVAPEARLRTTVQMFLGHFFPFPADDYAVVL